MQATSQQQSPTVRISRSSPPAQSQSMLAQGQFVGGGWNEGFNGGYLSALPNNIKDDPRFHKRASSGSSVTSAGPDSPLDQTTLHPRIATSDVNFPPSYDFDFSGTPQSAHTSKSLPVFAEMGLFQPYTGSVNMRRIQSSGADERASFGAPQSVSSMSHNSPATPHTNYDLDYDEKAFHGEIFDNDDDMFSYLQDPGYPSTAYQQSLQDVFPDQPFQPAMSFQQMQRMGGHRQSMMQDRLQAAQNDHLRTNSPTSNPRDKSPFRQSSRYMPAPTQRPTQVPQVPQLQNQRTSISPKELLLDENDIDENAAPLFSESQFAHRRKPSNLSTFYTPSYGPEPTIQIPQQYPFVGHQRQSSVQENPEFHAPMLSMESTAEEGPSEPSSQSSPRSREVTRPVDTHSDSGTYSCTYHGCTLRFDSPVKLQKHKREGHRQTSPSSPNLALRNSQAGPHRCDRINPSTGKPCNSIFSRPYDLTRHEDTIHNARKQKIRCEYCTEEKLFSRKDAWSRHIRVIHPHVQIAGKERKKHNK